MQRFTFEQTCSTRYKILHFFPAYLSFEGIYGASVESLLCCMRFPVRCALYSVVMLIVQEFYLFHCFPFVWVRGASSIAASECSDVGYSLQVCRQLYNRIRQILTTSFLMGSNKVAIPQRPGSPLLITRSATGVSQSPFLWSRELTSQCH